MEIDQLKNYREDILEIAERHNAPNIRVFGSVARGEADEDSDVDFLIDVSSKQSIFDVIRLIRALSELLGCKVDVAQSTVLHPMMRDEVLKEAIPLKDL